MGRQSFNIESVVQDARAKANFALACLVVSKEFDCKPDDVVEGAGAFLFQQKVAIYLSVVEFRSTQARVALAVGCGETKIRGAVRAVEERREDPDFDARMDRLVSRACPMAGGRPAVYG